MITFHPYEDECTEFKRELTFRDKSGRQTDTLEKGKMTPVVEIYSDRLAIVSYGGLVHGLTREDFFAGRSMIRNRELMRVFRDLKFVEQLGSGMSKILHAYPKDIFNFSDNFLEVCFEYEKGYLESLKNNALASEKTEKFWNDFGKNSEAMWKRFLKLSMSTPTIVLRKLQQKSVKRQEQLKATLLNLNNLV